METSDDESDWGYCEATTVSMQDPRAWITTNPDSLLNVQCLNLELPDEVEEISYSIGSLLNLRTLNITRGRSLKYLPHALTKLLHLDQLFIQNCPLLVELPSFLVQLFSLESLRVRNCGIKCLPDILPSLDNFSYLTLNDCPNLYQLPCNMSQIPNLKRLSLQDCPIESLAGNISVDTLRLKGRHVKCFSTKPRKLKNLELNCCLFEQDILASLKDFDHLQTLLVRGCMKESLPVAISEPNNLKDLEVSEFPNIKKFSKLVNLTSLTIQSCPMDILAIEGCVSLVSLCIIHCHMKSIKTTGLTKLGFLWIKNCQLLEHLSTDLNSLVRLHNLSLEDCKSLNELPADFDKLANLSELRLMDTNIQSFPSTINSVHKLPSLKVLYLPMCFRLETLPKDLNFHWISVYVPPRFRLPANYSATDNVLYLKVEKNYDLEEMMSQDLFIEQTTIKAPFNTTNLRQLHPDDGLNVIGETTSYHTLLTPEDRSSVNPDERHRSLELTEGVESHAYDKGIENQAMLCDEYSPTDPVMREDAAARELSNDEIAGETTNQQAPSSLGGKTLESEGEGDGPLGLIELSDSSANGAETDKCLPSSQDDNNTPARKGKRAQKTITTEQNRSPTGKKDAHRKTKINKEEVLQLLIDSNLTRKAAAARLNVSPSTFNQYLRMESIKWPHRRATKRLQRGCEGINRLDHRATKRLQTDHTAKPILNNFVIKAEYEEDVVKFECSTSTSIDELRDIVGKKFNLDQQAFKLKYLDETNEMILMVDTSDIVGAFEAAIEKNEKFVRILVL